MMTIRSAHASPSMWHRGAALVLLLAVTMTSVLAAYAPAAEAQTPVVGTADFRNAPQLVPGTYSDRLVTGDSAWYSLIYTNGTPYEFEVDFQGSVPRGLELTASFVAPTLTTVDGPDSSVSGSGVIYPSGHTNLWFLKVSLETTGQAGVEYPVVISVAGVQSVGVAACNDTPGCTFDVEYAELNVAVGEAEARLEEIGALETASAVSAEIENLRGFAESSATLLPGALARLERNETAMSNLCAPDPMCDTFPNPGSTTPFLGWIVGAIALVGGGYIALKKLSDPETDGDEGNEPRAPSAIDRARREAAAKKKAEKKAEKKRK